MTIDVSTSSTTAEGNGVTTIFTFDFTYVSASDIFVTFTDASGNQTDLTPAQYTLVLNAPASNSIWGVGGTVTYPLTGSPITTGQTLTIYRILPLTQTTSIANQGTFYPTVVEQALDTLCMEIQEVSAASQNAIVAPLVDVDPQMVLPAAALRANLYCVFDANGNVFAGAPATTGVTISAAMIPVVQASTLALGRTAFGLGSSAVENLLSDVIDNGAGSLTYAGVGTIASAATTDIGTVAGPTITVSGTATITSLGNSMKQGQRKRIRATGAFTLTNGANLKLPGSANYVAASGDLLEVFCDGTATGNNVYYVEIYPVSGKAIVGGIPAGGTTGQALTKINSTDYNVQWASISGKVAQIVNVETGAVATGSTVMPQDDTIPQNTEGDQYMSLAITPTNASSTLIIQVIANGSLNGTANVEAALFQDSTANAIAATSIYFVTASGPNSFVFTHKMTAGTTSATTFKLRIGPSTAATWTFNGLAGVRLFAGLNSSSITITEISP
jgi:hypothetical protein